MQRKLDTYVFPLVAMLVASWGVFRLSAAVPEGLAETNCLDTYFGADVHRGFSDLTSRWTEYGGSTKHPIFCLLVLPVFAIEKLFAADPWLAVRILLSLNAALFAGLMYALAKRVAGHGIDALALVGLMLSSNAAIFWLPIPETYPFGATSVLLPLGLLLLSEAWQRDWLHSVSHLVTMSITITNVTSGLVVSLLKLGWKRAATVSIYAIGLLYLVMMFQPLIVPESGFVNAREILFQNQRYGNKQPVTTTLGHFFLTPNSSPEILCSIAAPTKWKENHWPRLDFLPREEPLFATIRHPSRPLQLAQTAAWIVLLAVGLVHFLWLDRDSSVLGASLLVLLGHLLITLKYGNESFIYTLHWTALLVLLAGGLLKSGYRFWVLGIISFLTITNLWSNVSVFQETMSVLSDAIVAAADQS